MSMSREFCAHFIPMDKPCSECATDGAAYWKARCLKAEAELAVAKQDAADNHLLWAHANNVACEFKSMLHAALDDDWEQPDLVAYRVQRSGWTPMEAHLSAKGDASRASEGVAEAPLVEDGPGRATGGSYQGDAPTSFD